MVKKFYLDALSMLLLSAGPPQKTYLAVSPVLADILRRFEEGQPAPYLDELDLSRVEQYEIEAMVSKMELLENAQRALFNTSTQLHTVKAAAATRRKFC